MVGAIAAHDVDVARAAERDQLAVGRPAGAEVTYLLAGELGEVAPVDIHNIDMVDTVPLRGKGDLLAVRRKVGLGVFLGVVTEVALAVAGQ